MDITERLIDYALHTKSDAIPEAVLQVQKRSLIDAVGVMQAASTQCDSCAAFAQYAQTQGEGTCTVFSFDRKASAADAALVNGSMSHALDYEDTSSRATLHPNAVSTPALLALAEAKGAVQGKELLAALAIASDICCRLSLACREDLSKYGWYMPPVFGSMGAVLGGCRLMGLDEKQTLDALACNLFACTGSSQLINSKNSTMRSVRDGFAARAAVTSVLLAMQNIQTGFEEPFEGNKGFFAAYAKNDCDLSAITNALGEEFIGGELVFKFWPTCLGTHTGIQTILELMDENALKFDDIQSVHLKVSEFAKNILLEPRAVKNRPETAINAKFSIPYTLGLAAKRRKISLADFSPERIFDEDIYAFAQRVSYEVDEKLTEKYQTNFIEMTLTTTKGVFRRYCEKALGEPEKPMSDAVFHEKFFDCMSLSRKHFSTQQIESIFSQLMQIDQVRDVSELIARL